MWVGAEGAAYAQVTERLPTTVSASQAHNIKQDQSVNPWTAMSGFEQNIDRGTSVGRTRMRDVFVAEGFRLVRLRFDWESSQSLYGQTIARVTPIRLMAENNTVHEMIGYCLVHVGDNTLDLWLRQTNGRPVMANQLPNVYADDELYLYFQVPIGQTITGLMVGNLVEEFGQFLEPLKVEGN